MTARPDTMNPLISGISLDLKKNLMDLMVYTAKFRSLEEVEQ